MEPKGPGLAAVEPMEAELCVDALEEALDRYGKPEIFNSDQGSQFTSIVFTQTLKTAGVRISMDGKDPGLQPHRGEDPAWRARPSAFQACRRGGRWLDNVFVERLWHR